MKIIRISFFQFDPYHHVRLELDHKKLGMPTLEKVAEIFFAIIPDLPIPAVIHHDNLKLNPQL